MDKNQIGYSLIFVETLKPYNEKTKKFEPLKFKRVEVCQELSEFFSNDEKAKNMMFDKMFEYKNDIKKLLDDNEYCDFPSYVQENLELKQQITRLEAKLAESEKDLEIVCVEGKDKIREYAEITNRQREEIFKLKQQLASQRNEIYETVIKAMTKHWEDIMSKSGWWLNCGKCKDMEKFFKSVIIDNKIPLTRQEAEINFILEQQIKELKGEE